MDKPQAFVGFPEGMVRDKPVRLPVIANQESWFALDKPVGLLGRAHPWYPGRGDITTEIRRQIDGGKPELAKLSIRHAYYICGPDPEIAGPVVFAKNEEAGNRLKNAYGSDQFKFIFRFVTDACMSVAETECGLPVAMHTTDAKACISHKTGKKSLTRFRKVAETSDLALWEAETRHPRMHQIRIHAFESGIPILGDPIYGFRGTDNEPMARSVKRNFVRYFAGLAVVLTEIDGSRVFSEIDSVSGELPKPFRSLLRKSGLEGG